MRQRNQGPWCLGSFGLVEWLESSSFCSRCWLSALSSTAAQMSAVVVLAFLALAGSLVFLASLERPNHPWARWARLVGWQMMAAFSIVPTSSMYVSMVIVVLALPAVFAGFQRS